MGSHLMPVEKIQKKIFFIRGEKVMLDKDLAELYQVETRILIQAVKRNRGRFPAEFMFQVSNEEFKSLISQIVISKRGGTRKLPYAFTQEGVAMLSSVLKSERAIKVNIQIIKTFVQLRKLAITHVDLHKKIDEMEKKYDAQFQVVFQSLRQLLDGSRGKMKKVHGFIPDR